MNFEEPTQKLNNQEYGNQTETPKPAIENKQKIEGIDLEEPINKKEINPNIEDIVKDLSSEYPEGEYVDREGNKINVVHDKEEGKE